MKNQPVIFIFIVISFFLGFLAGSVTSYSDCQKKMQKEAVKQGVARYEVDAEGNVTFVWKKPLVGIQFFDADSSQSVEDDPLRGVKGPE